MTLSRILHNYFKSLSKLIKLFSEWNTRQNPSSFHFNRFISHMEFPLLPYDWKHSSSQSSNHWIYHIKIVLLLRELFELQGWENWRPFTHLERLEFHGGFQCSLVRDKYHSCCEVTTRHCLPASEYHRCVRCGWSIPLAKINCQEYVSIFNVRDPFCWCVFYGEIHKSCRYRRSSLKMEIFSF